MSKVLYTDFEGVEDIISSMMDSPMLKKGITKMNLFKFWEDILPEKFKGKSRPYGMTSSSTMIVGCQNPVVAQEMSLHKIMLLKKFEPYAKTLNLRVVDLKFDPKKY